MLAVSMDRDKDMLALPAEAKSERAEHAVRAAFGRTERLVEYVRRCPHRDSVYFRIGENES
jgi:hypothetical protein